jgi:hypothetical protein
MIGSEEDSERTEKRKAKNRRTAAQTKMRRKARRKTAEDTIIELDKEYALLQNRIALLTNEKEILFEQVMLMRAAFPDAISLNRSIISPPPPMEEPILSDENREYVDRDEVSSWEGGFYAICN